eukprot:CAMPEP_0171511498 /NCGR_PEP_ID=MMETSP0959-20130129/1026_1 /TAXON_ID=87120 /ORGANISM="Aurantiochytrium limacinum, Strain ATCCMYA-1381" /LENGTH=133 /DNA_ID=CAMNT_0012049127 /DNA_START=107 /DNA_END=508 /DNA_ORIENTATION=-
MSLRAEVGVKDGPREGLGFKGDALVTINEDIDKTVGKTNKLKGVALVPVLAANKLCQLAESVLARSLFVLLCCANTAKKGAIESMGDVVTILVTKHHKAEGNTRVSRPVNPQENIINNEVPSQASIHANIYIS